MLQLGERGSATVPSAWSGWRRSPTALTGAGWLIGLVTTALIIGTPYLLFAYHSPEFHLVLDVVDACTASLLSYLVYGRYLRTRRLRDLLLAEGLLLLAFAGFGLTLDPLEDRGSHADTRTVWLPMVLRVAGAVLVAAGALAPDAPLTPVAHRRAQMLLWTVICVALAAVGLAGDQLPVALAKNPPASAQHPVITGHPALIGAQVASAVLFLVASLAFTRQAVRRSDELLRWLGPACALAGFARVNYALFPSLYSGWLYTGDLLRTSGYLLLLVGAAREIGRYWSAHARVAVLEDRRRLARELHDGLVQELAYIRMEAVDISDDKVSHDILASCDRALDEARAAVDALGRSPNEPLGFVLHRAAQQVAERYHGRVDVDLDDSVASDQELRHALVRITREAVSNAIRHGRAERIHLRLTTEMGRTRLTVQDDGAGFDVAAVESSGTGFGLTSMAERARALGASFTVNSTPGCGTRVSVTW